MDQQKCRHERVVTYKYIESDPVRVCEDCGAKNPEPFKPISPFDMGRMLADVLGLGNVRGIMRLAVVVEGGSAPRVEVTRMMTEYEAEQWDDSVLEWCDGLVDVYNADRARWLALHLDFAGFVDPPTEDNAFVIDEARAARGDLGRQAVESLADESPTLHPAQVARERGRLEQPREDREFREYNRQGDNQMNQQNNREIGRAHV